MRLGRLLVTLVVLQQLALPVLHAAAAHPVATDDGGWVYICTAAGVERVAVGGLPDAGAEGGTSGAAGCPLCQFHNATALPPSPEHSLLPIREEAALGDRFVADESLRPQARPTPVGARAPPIES